ncbi:MAG: GIY-YIG nuclease family protein [Tenuifilaceae bacterium]
MNTDASYDGCHPQNECWSVYIFLCADNTHYTGCTSNINERIVRHNKGQVAYTKSRLPVKLIFYANFTSKYRAYEFEKYLKTGSGRAFAKKHLL